MGLIKYRLFLEDLATKGNTVEYMDKFFQDKSEYNEDLYSCYYLIYTMNYMHF